MSGVYSKQWTLGAIALAALLIGVGAYVFFCPNEPAPAPITERAPSLPPPDPQVARIGSSVEGRPIESYTFGKGSTRLLFVGGIHGGYEWNSVILAYEFIDALTKDPSLVPADLSVTIVPSANPDGLAKVVPKEGRFTVVDVYETGPVGTGRMNANNVDLNRNFDCKWKPKSSWRGNVVSAGTKAFSEPEAAAIRDLVTTLQPNAVVFWHSQSNTVYASECEDGILPETRTVMDTYAKAAGYKAVDTFDAYEVTGDAEGWLASIGIPAITVELSTHEAIEWEKNLAGVKALFGHYTGK
jgi:predicted deacylase